MDIEDLKQKRQGLRESLRESSIKMGELQRQFKAGALNVEDEIYSLEVTQAKDTRTLESLSEQIHAIEATEDQQKIEAIRDEVNKLTEKMETLANGVEGFNSKIIKKTVEIVRLQHERNTLIIQNDLFGKLKTADFVNLELLYKSPGHRDGWIIDRRLVQPDGHAIYDEVETIIPVPVPYIKKPMDIDDWEKFIAHQAETQPAREALLTNVDSGR